MARSEARISVEVWNDHDFRALSRDAQWAFMFLLSQHDLAHDGVIALRVRRWSQCAAGMTADDLEGFLEELEAARFIVVDRDTEELLIRSFIRRDKVYKQPNVLRAAADHLPLVTSAAIRYALAVELARISQEPMPEGSTAIVAEMRKGLPDPSENPSPNPSPEGSGNPSAGTPGVRGVVTAVVSDFPVPRSSKSPGPGPQGAPPARPSRAHALDRPATRIPDGFAPTAEMVDWARQNTPLVGTRETEAFVDYWRGVPGTKGRKTDWPATWRNWMRRTQIDAQTRNARASPRNGLIERDGLLLKPETIANLDRTARFAAIDAQLAIEGGTA